MTLIRRFIATSTAGIILATFSLAFAQKSTTPAVKTGYAPITASISTTKSTVPENR